MILQLQVWCVKASGRHLASNGMDGKVVVLECFYENGVSENEVKFQFNGKLIKLRLDLLGLRQFCPFIINANLFSLVHFLAETDKKIHINFPLVLK